MADIATEPKGFHGTALISLLYVARGLRGFGDGFAIIIPAGLHDGAGLRRRRGRHRRDGVADGNALLTLITGWIAPRHDLRALLIFGAGLMAATGIAFPGRRAFRADRAGRVHRHRSTPRAAILACWFRSNTRCWRRARPTTADPVFAALQPDRGTLHRCGSLAATLPDFLVSHGGTTLGAFRLMFYAYAALGILSARFIAIVPHARGEERAQQAPLGPSRGTVYRLAALFSIDAFAAVSSPSPLLVLWLFERFDLSLSAAGVFFFWSSTLSAFSYPVAAWIAKRIGLVNTMVFTHIPSSIF
jgi:hypothetical protein